MTPGLKVHPTRKHIRWFGTFYSKNTPDDKSHYSLLKEIYHSNIVDLRLD